jgi:pSer/pThr/pTyr-binding forkhead associated (FHA) protein
VIEAQGGEFEITALRTTNGTYVNGVELASGAKHRLSMGDEIQFGSEGVKLTFLSAGHILSSSFFK